MCNKSDTDHGSLNQLTLYDVTRQDGGEYVCKSTHAVAGVTLARAVSVAVYGESLIVFPVDDAATVAQTKWYCTRHLGGNANRLKLRKSIIAEKTEFVETSAVVNAEQNTVDFRCIASSDDYTPIRINW